MTTPRLPRLVYVAGPFRAATVEAVEQNKRRAEEVGRHLAQLGAWPVVPHTCPVGSLDGQGRDDAILEGCCRLVETVDAVVLQGH